MSDPVSHPAHYTMYKVEVLDLIDKMEFWRGSVVKYASRAGHKANTPEKQDLEKAKFLIERRLRELEDGE